MERKIGKSKRQIKKWLAIAGATVTLYHEAGRFDSTHFRANEFRIQGVQDARTWASIRTPKIFYWRGELRLKPEQIQAMNKITELAKDVFPQKNQKYTTLRVLATLKANAREIREKGPDSITERLIRKLEENPSAPKYTLEAWDRIIMIMEYFKNQPQKVREEMLRLAGVEIH